MNEGGHAREKENLRQSTGKRSFAAGISSGRNVLSVALALLLAISMSPAHSLALGGSGSGGDAAQTAAASSESSASVTSGSTAVSGAASSDSAPGTSSMPEASASSAGDSPTVPNIGSEHVGTSPESGLTAQGLSPTTIESVTTEWINGGTTDNQGIYQVTPQGNNFDWWTGHATSPTVIEAKLAYAISGSMDHEPGLSSSGSLPISSPTAREPHMARATLPFRKRPR